MDEPPSSPPSGNDSCERQLAWYKREYERLEEELTDFRVSSQELEAELEKDLEESDKRERALKEKVEGLGFEVEEWKNKYKQSKTEAAAAQSQLQKEITTLRDANRTLQMKLRDIEVANDDFERQARNTSSSLEDMESKLNQSIERAVLMEEEIKQGEQEREQLRIETQRLRDELGDLKIEAEIMQDKLKRSETRAHLPMLSTGHDGMPPSSPFPESPASVASSPFVSTPPDTKSVSTAQTLSETSTPPSPPVSDRSAGAKPAPRPYHTPLPRPQIRSIRQPSADLSITPKPRNSNAVTSATPSLTRSRAMPSLSTAAKRAPAPHSSRNPPQSLYNRSTAGRGLPNSQSLTHIRNLTAQMQRLEARVQTARSKLPAPVNTPPRASPRDANGSAIPTSVTIRSRKRTGGSTVSGASSLAGSLADETPTVQAGARKHASRISTSGISRLSFGPVSSRGGSTYNDGVDSSRPNSRASVTSGAPSHSGFVRQERPGSRADSTRPQSRSEMARPSSRADSALGTRPMSRTSMSGARTPLGHYSQNLAESRRPRSSIGGNLNFSQSVGPGGSAGAYAGGGHGHSQSVTHIDLDTFQEFDPSASTSRRNSVMNVEGSAIPVPRRQSGGIPVPKTPGRRTSSGVLREGERERTLLEKKRSEASLAGSMKPPPMPTARRKLSEVGESY